MNKVYLIDLTMKSKFLKNWFRKETTVRAIKVALVIGPVLTIINQHDVILAGQFDFKFCYKLVLTFMVPYCVSAYSSAKTYSSIDK